MFALPPSRLRRDAPRLLLPILVALLHLGCQDDPVPAPVAGDPPEDFDCEADAAISLDRVQPESTLTQPGWLQVCTVCPASSIDFWLGDRRGGSVPLEQAWAQGGRCALAVPRVPWPDRDSLPAEVRISSGQREGRYRWDVPLTDERGPPPVAGARVFRLPGGLSAPRLPSGANPALLGDGPDLLLRLGAGDDAGDRPLSLGLLDASGLQQDRCEPTVTWTGSFEEDERLFHLRLDPGDSLPGASGIIFRRGVLQGRLSADGSVLEDAVLMGLVDLLAMAADSGVAPEQACEDMALSMGYNPCTPCEAPRAGPSGLRECVAMLWEWPQAVLIEGDRRFGAFQDVDLSSEPPCGGGDDDDSAD